MVAQDVEVVYDGSRPQGKGLEVGGVLAELVIVMFLKRHCFCCRVRLLPSSFSPTVSYSVEISDARDWCRTPADKDVT